MYQRLKNTLRDTELRVVLDIESITSKTYVLNQLGSQCKGAMFIANGLKDKVREAVKEKGKL